MIIHLTITHIFQEKGIWGYGPHNNIIIRNNVVYNTPGSGIRFNDSDYITLKTTQFTIQHGGLHLHQVL